MKALWLLPVLASLSCLCHVDGDAPCSTCPEDSDEEHACYRALNGCQLTQEEDTPEENEACEAAADANCRPQGD